MYIFSFDGEAAGSAVFSTITAAQKLSGAGVAQIAGTDISGTSEVYQPNRGAYKGLPVRALLISAETAAVNFTFDGTTPTVAAGTNIGHQLAAGASYVVSGQNNVRNFQCINSVAANGAIVKASMLV